MVFENDAGAKAGACGLGGTRTSGVGPIAGATKGDGEGPAGEGAGTGMVVVGTGGANGVLVTGEAAGRDNGDAAGGVGATNGRLPGGSNADAGAGGRAPVAKWCAWAKDLVGVKGGEGAPAPGGRD